jgi:hypothetical protein
MRAALGSERWRLERTHPGRLAGHAVEAGRASGCASGARTASRSSCAHAATAQSPRCQRTSGQCLGRAHGYRAGSCVMVLWAALWFEWAYIAVELACTVQQRLAVMHGTARSEQLSARAVVKIAGRIISKVASREGTIISLRLVEHGDMRSDALLLDQPVQHCSRPVCGIGHKPLWLETEALFCPLDHGPCRADLGLANGAGTFHVNDDTELELRHSDRTQRPTFRSPRSLQSHRLARRAGVSRRARSMGWRLLSFHVSTN